MRHLNRIAALAIASTLMAQNPNTQLTAPNVPAALQVPTGNVEFLRTRAEGTQNYVCSSFPSGFAWTFIGPQATVFLRFQWFSREALLQVATHYLSPNPSEAGTARPIWQSALDTSAVWAKAIANSSDPNFVAPGAIPWLLLQVTGSRPGTMGGAALTPTTYILRIGTAGGVVPSTGCSDPAHIGVIAFVPYTAEYVFYKKSR